MPISIQINKRNSTFLETSINGKPGTEYATKESFNWQRRNSSINYQDEIHKVSFRNEFEKKGL